MARNKWEFGELNPNIVARNGHQLDPARFSAYDVQQKIIENHLSPTGFKNLQGPLRGIVLRIEKKTSQAAFGEFRGAQEVTKDPLVRIKVRIPELHPFPEPKTYGPEGDDSIISLYPTFVAISVDIPEPAVGEVVYVDYGDRENLEDPRYYGRIFNVPIFGGTNQTAEETKTSSLFDKVSSSLKEFLAPPVQAQDPTPIVPTAEPAKTCKEEPSKNQFFNTDFSECMKNEVIPGEYDLYSRGQVIGTTNMTIWTNIDGTKKLVRDDVVHTLEQMRNDMRQQAGLELIINSGFRSFETQQCMYEKYQQCYSEWVKSGKKGVEPSVVSNPQKSGPNSHLTGRAVDFSTGVDRSKFIDDKSTKSQAQILSDAKRGSYTKVWQWLINNSQKYGWVWTGFSFNEPWHFEWNEQLARNSGIYPRT